MITDVIQKALSCIECERLRNQQFAKLPTLRRQAQIKAIDNNATYGIYFDTEDKVLRSASVQTCRQNGYDILEYVSKYP